MGTVNLQQSVGLQSKSREELAAGQGSQSSGRTRLAGFSTNAPTEFGAVKKAAGSSEKIGPQFLQPRWPKREKFVQLTPQAKINK